MLARRFTIVCLLAALFGMVFAGLAARDGHLPKPGGRGANCGWLTETPCKPNAARF